MSQREPDDALGRYEEDVARYVDDDAEATAPEDDPPGMTDSSCDEEDSAGSLADFVVDSDTEEGSGDDWVPDDDEASGATDSGRDEDLVSDDDDDDDSASAEDSDAEWSPTDEGEWVAPPRPPERESASAQPTRRRRRNEGVPEADQSHIDSENILGGKRARRPVSRYRDPRYLELMLTE